MVVNHRNRLHRWLGRVAILILAIGIALNFSYFLRLFYPIHFRDKIERHAQENDVDPMLLAAIIRSESRFRPQVVSAKGAVGLMQIMPETGTYIAQQIGFLDFTVEQLQDPDVNIRLGAWYVSDLQRQFNNNLPVVLAAYNAGRGNVRQWLENGVWDGTEENLDDIPFKETKQYVGSVLEDYDRYHRLYVE